MVLGEEPVISGIAPEFAVSVEPVRRLLTLVVGMALLAPAMARADSAFSSAELVTVTASGFQATWTTSSSSDTTVCWGRVSPMENCRHQETSVQYHHATVDGLAASTAYVYSLMSDGVAQPRSSTNPSVFTTLTPPPGRHLFDFALMNDLHVGEQCSGTAANAPLIGSSVPPCFSAPDYAARMDAADVGELFARHIPLAVINGDLTSTATYDQERQAQQILNGLGGIPLIVRGNHDRAAQQSSETRCGTGDDCFSTVFFPGRSAGRVYYSTDFGGYHFVVLDSSDASGLGDLTDAPQNAWLARDLAAHRATPTFIAFHHPVAEYADTYATPPVVFGVAPYKGGSGFLSTVAANPQVVGVLNGHTHRNFNAYALASGARTPFIENGAAKEYPGGYSIFSVYQGGYTRSYFRPSNCYFCRQWTATTSGEYFGTYPSYTLGSLGTRNFTHVYGCAAQTPPQSLPGESLAPGGGVATPPASCLSRVTGSVPGGPVADGEDARHAPGGAASGGQGVVQSPGNSGSRRCAAVRGLTFRLHTVGGNRIVRVRIYVDGRLRLQRQARHLTRVKFRYLFAPAHHRIRVDTFTRNGLARRTERRVSGCIHLPPRALHVRGRRRRVPR